MAKKKSSFQKTENPHISYQPKMKLLQQLKLLITCCTVLVCLLLTMTTHLYATISYNYPKPYNAPQAIFFRKWSSVINFPLQILSGFTHLRQCFNGKFSFLSSQQGKIDNSVTGNSGKCTFFRHSRVEYSTREWRIFRRLRRKFGVEFDA